MSESTLLRLLGQHATACWMTEASACGAVGHELRGDYARALYFRTRAVVLYDRARDALEATPEAVEAEFATVNRRTPQGGA